MRAPTPIGFLLEGSEDRRSEAVTAVLLVHPGHAYPCRLTPCPSGCACDQFVSVVDTHGEFGRGRDVWRCSAVVLVELTAEAFVQSTITTSDNWMKVRHERD